MFGCKHKYIEQSRRFSMCNPNRFERITLKDLSDRERERLIQSILFGITSILLQCKDCGRTKSELIVGDHTMKGGE